MRILPALLLIYTFVCPFSYAQNPTFRGHNQTAGGGGGGRSIVLNGSSQYAQVSLPNSSPWTSYNTAGFQIEFRLHTATSGIDVFDTVDSGPSIHVWEVAASSGTRYDLNEGRDSFSIAHTPTAFTDVVIKIQFDPSNSRITYESWKSDGTGYVSNTHALSTTSAYNLGGGILTLGGNYAGVNLCAIHMAWFGVRRQVDAMGSGNFPGTDIPPGSWDLKYTFDSNNGNDSSGNGLNLTLTGAPTFENTP